MQRAMGRSLALLALVAVPVSQALEQRANPIRKVVTMLQRMQKKVQQEGEAEQKLYDKFMCYCKSGGGDLDASITSAEAKAPSVSSDIDAAEGRHAQLKTDLKQAQVDRSAAKDAMALATAVREKEAAAFSAEKTDYDANIAAIGKAVASLEKGMSGAFLQTETAQVLRKLVLSEQEMPESDRRELVSFLSSSEGSSYAPQSGEITGILKEMKDTMSKNLAEATAEEESAIKLYQELMAAKSKEVGALTSSVEAKTGQIGELGVDIVHMKEDLSDTEAALAEDQKFLAELKNSCSTKTAQWNERSKTRSDELVALAETIKVLNDDDALELFKNTLPSAGASFVQVASKASGQQQQALDAVQKARQAASQQQRPGLDLLALALSGKKALSKGGFEKVTKMCDNMMDVLKKEQQDDDHKKEYCAEQSDLSDDKRKALERRVSDKEAAIENSKEYLATVKEDMATLEAGIAALDKMVAEATEQRKSEHVEFQDLMASNSAAKDLMHFAKNRLNKFYNPKLFKPAPKRELSSEDRIVVNMGGEAPPTAAPGGIADTGIAVLAQVSAHAHRKDAPAPPPATWDAYSTKSEETTGVIAMIDLLIKDLDKEMTEAETAEKDAQADYESMMNESAQKRVVDSKDLMNKGSAKADMEGALEAHKEAKTDASKELMATLKYIESIHSECDWLLKYFDVRKEARAGEIDSLVKAKAILNGADFSFVQTQAHGFLQRSA